MLSVEQIQFEIAKFSMEHLHEIYKEFCFDKNEKEEKLQIKQAVTCPANWTYIDEDDIFDCEPLDDQLRAYIIFNDDKTEILSIEVIGE